jgi:flagellar hook protein FlgE
MGIFGAMTTAVSGLRAQSYALENISGNIANSQTTGFKRLDTSFVDLIPDLPYRKELAGSVGGFSRLTNTLQGDLQSTGVSTNMALNGEGYFIVQERTGYNNNRPIFGGSDLYTRRGDFALDKDGFLVNGAGFYLRGSSIDPVTGQVSGGDTGVIQISSEPLPARQTTTIQYRANLPSIPATSARDAAQGAPNSELLGAPPPAPAAPAPAFPAGYDPRVTTTPAPAGAGFVVGSDEARFMSQTVEGGLVPTYNAVGAQIDVELRWAKIDSTPGNETWNLFYRTDTSAVNNEVAWRNLGVPFRFNSSGQMTAPSPGTVTVTGLTVDGTTVGNVSFDFSSGGLTSFARAGGKVEQSLIQQDGYSSGSLDSVSVTSDGRISGTYSNGRVVPVALLSVAQFNADNALKRRDGGVYEQTLESGIPLIGLNGTTVIGGNVEGSNTDIAEEFSKMIVTQQAYSANTRVVSTSQQMLSEVLNMLR